MTRTEPHQASGDGDKAAAMEDLELQLSLLWRRARTINHQLARSVHPDLEAAAYGLLSVLLHKGRMRLTDLARHVGVGKPSISRQIALLTDIGLVQKQDDPADGRAQLIELTAWGREKMTLIQTGRQTAFHARLKDWDEAEIASLASLLARLNNDYSS